MCYPKPFVCPKEGYSALAGLAFTAGWKLFRLRPKCHMLKEISLALAPGPTDRVVLSPAATSCWADEDFIGRVSRASRSCHGLSVSIGAMRKTMGMYKAQFKALQEAAKNR